MSESSAPSKWSMEFLKTTAGIMVLSPVVGALIFLLAGQAMGREAEPLDIALQGAKIIGLIGAFAAPLIALALVVREIKQQGNDTPRD